MTVPSTKGRSMVERNCVYQGRNNIRASLTSAILLDRRSIDSARETVDIDSTTNEKFLLWNSGTEINVVLVGTPQSSLIVDIHTSLNTITDP
jgi:hypothetical protein